MITGAEGRDFDVVLWGATGFTGKLVARHFVETYGDELKWAMAGRNPGKLEQLREELGRPDIPIIVADSTEPDSLESLARQARVVCTTVGPYAKYGTELVAACVNTGTHYCDLAGEVQWMSRIIDQYQNSAMESGARIVHTCGFDSIPSDLGTFYLQGVMHDTFGNYADQVHARVGKFSGSASGGTIASMMYMMEEAGQNPALAEAMANPYALNPQGERSGPDVEEENRAVYDEDFGQWTCPFMMAAINTRVVRRSHALAEYPYGKSFRYEERQLTGGGRMGKRKAARVAFGSKVTPPIMSVAPLRKLAARLLPSPGEGPSPSAQREGHFELFLQGRIHATQETLTVRVSGDRDPGYGATSRMLGEAAVCLAQDDLGTPGGVLTPATAMGATLIQRLQDSAGITFEIM